MTAGLIARNIHLEKYESVDETYKKYGIDALRNTYVSVCKNIENVASNSVMTVFAKRLLSLYKIKISMRINEKGELETSYYQTEE